MERLADFTNEGIKEADIPSVVQTLFRVGDRLLLPEDEQQHMFDPADNGLRIGWIIWPLLKRLHEARRFEILRSACIESDSISLITRFVSYLAGEHGKYTNNPPTPEQERILTANHVEELERIALKTIRSARDNTLIETPYLPHVLLRWSNWAGEAEVKNWVEGAVTSDAGLLKYLSKYLQKSFSAGVNDHVAQVRYRLDPEWLKPFISPDKIIDRARKLLVREGLSERERTALKCFVDEYDIRRSGKNPDSPFGD